MKIYCDESLIVRNLKTNLTTIVSKQNMKYSKKHNCWFYNLKEKGHFKIRTKDGYCFMNIKSKGYFVVLQELECINEL